MATPLKVKRRKFNRNEHILLSKKKRTGPFTKLKWSKSARSIFSAVMIEGIQNILRTGQDYSRQSRMRVTPQTILTMMNLQLVPGEVCDLAQTKLEQSPSLLSRSAIYRQLKLFFPRNGITKSSISTLNCIGDVLAERLAVAASNQTILGRRSIINEADVCAASRLDAAMCTLTAGRTMGGKVPALTRLAKGSSMNYELCGPAGTITA